MKKGLVEPMAKMVNLVQLGQWDMLVNLAYQEQRESR